MPMWVGGNFLEQGGMPLSSDNGVPMLETSDGDGQNSMIELPSNQSFAPNSDIPDMPMLLRGSIGMLWLFPTSCR